jgi:hypothetical protein
MTVGLLSACFASPVSGDPTGSTSPPVPGPTQCSIAILLQFGLGAGQQTSGSLTETCAFKPGTFADVGFMGRHVESKLVPASGLISLHFTAGDPELSIDGGAFQPATWDVNSIVATGINPSGATNTATFLVDIAQPVTTAAATTGVGGFNTTNGASPGSSTGTGTAPGSIGLAFTGANLIALIGAALCLLLFGAAIVIYTRRKAAKITRHREATRTGPLLVDVPEGAWRMRNIW